MALRVVADTNVYVSIFQFGGRLSQILELAVDRAIDLFVSTPIVMELSGVLAEKFCWSVDRVQQVIDTLALFCHSVTPQELVRAAADPDDDRILECALAANAEVIVSGDTHLLELKSFRGIPIMNPRQFLDRAPWKV
jgi:putative PIN family toxin of toxin-antitoxin system